MEKRVLCFLYTLILTLCFSQEGVSNIDTWGIGARSSSMGGAFTAVADDFAAAWYNPAGLAQYRGHRVTMNCFYVRPDLQVKTIDGRDLVTTTTDGIIINDPVNGTSDSSTVITTAIGIEFNLNSAVEKFLLMDMPWNTQFGMALGLPSDVVITFMPPDQPHFINFGEYGESVTFILSLGSEIMKDFLYIGMGTNVAVHMEGMLGANNVRIGETFDESLIPFMAAFPIDGGMTPIAGLLVTPFNKKVKIGLSYRRENMMTDISPFGLQATFILGEYEASLQLAGSIKTWYFPEEYNLGVSIDLNRFLLSFEANNQMWSKYDYDEVEKLIYTGEYTQGYEPGYPEFDDTIEYRAGLEYRLSDHISLMGGYMHAISPVPDQSGRVSNYLDMDQDIFSIGASYALKTKPVTFSVVTKYFKFDGVTVNKEGVYGYTWGRSYGQLSYTIPPGSIIMGGIEMRLTF